MWSYKTFLPVFTAANSLGQTWYHSKTNKETFGMPILTNSSSWLTVHKLETQDMKGKRGLLTNFFFHATTMLSTSITLLYIAIPRPSSLMLRMLVNAPGYRIARAANPTIALISNRPRIRGTTLKTMIAETRANATTTTGVSNPFFSFAPATRFWASGACCGVTERRSASLSRKRVSGSATGVCWAIHWR